MAQISATIKDASVEAIKLIVKSDKRSFSQMVDILIEEALEARIKLKNKKGGNS